MARPAPPQSSRFVVLALAMVLLIGARLHWVKADVTQILADDHILMGGSRHLEAGQWRQLWAPQNDHLLPLYRLVRLPFDLHFPAWYKGFHALVVIAHLGSAAVLFFLARRYGRNAWAALVTALLFAWSTVGDQALLWKAAAPFVFSLTFLLLGAWLLTQPTALAAASAAAALACSVGFFSGALFALPGIFLMIFLLEPARRRRALVICLGVALAGAATWIVFVSPHVDLAHYGGPGLFTRLVRALVYTLRAYLYQLAMGLRLFSLHDLLALPPALAVVLLRRHLNVHWNLIPLALTAPLLFLITFIRQDPGVWSVSRYGYQGYVFWAVLFGGVLDAFLRRLEAWPRWRTGLLALLPIPAGLYLAVHFSAARQERDAMVGHTEVSRDFWLGWDRFFRLASAHRVQIGKPLVLPSLNLTGTNVQTIFMLCHPRGLPGWTLSHGHGTPEEQQEFRSEVAYIQARLPPSQKLVLPPGW